MPKGECGRRGWRAHRGPASCQTPSGTGEAGAQVHGRIGDITSGVISLEMAGKARDVDKITHKVLEKR